MYVFGKEPNLFIKFNIFNGVLISFVRTSFNNLNSENKSRPSISEWFSKLKIFSRLMQDFFNSSLLKVLNLFELNKNPNMFSYSKNCSNRLSIEEIDLSNIYKK